MGVARKKCCFVVSAEFDLDKAKKPKAKRLSSECSDGAPFSIPPDDVASHESAAAKPGDERACDRVAPTRCWSLPCSSVPMYCA